MTERVGRNAPCPCGSGAKYKHCCADKPDTTSTVSYFGLVFILVAAVIGGAVLVYAVTQDNPDGRVWSAAHGHWHDIGDSGGDGRAAAPPGPAPPGKVWSEEHGHWHDAG